MLSCEHSGLVHNLSSFLCPLQIKPLALRPLKVSEDVETVQELSRPHRSNSKEQLSEVSPWTRPLPFPQTSYGELGHPLSQAEAGGTPEVGYRERAGDGNIEAEIREQLVQ